MLESSLFNITVNEFEFVTRSNVKETVSTLRQKGEFDVEVKKKGLGSTHRVTSYCNNVLALRTRLLTFLVF